MHYRQSGDKVYELPFLKLGSAITSFNDWMLDSFLMVLSEFQAAKDVVLAEKPTICDDSNMLDSSLLDELLANIATLASVYHKPPDAFVSRARPTPQQDEDEEYNEGQDMGPSESSAPVPEVAATPATTQVPVAPAAPVPRTAAAQVPPTQPVADLLGDLMGLETALVPVGPATSAAPAQ
jgi:AP-1 complex subunit beta-1